MALPHGTLTRMLVATTHPAILVHMAHVLVFHARTVMQPVGPPMQLDISTNKPAIVTELAQPNIDVQRTIMAPVQMVQLVAPSVQQMMQETKADPVLEIIAQ